MGDQTKAQDRGLPTLTREELRALEDEPVIELIEEQRWWSGLDDERRTEVRAAALRSLLARDLVWPSGEDAAEIETDADLALLLASRHAPSWVLALGEIPVVGDGSTVPDPVRGAVLICGTPEDDHDQAVICAHVEGLYLNRLAPRDAATETAASWLLRVPSTPGEVVQRTVDVLAPDQPRRQGLVMGVDDAWTLSDQTRDGDTDDSPAATSPTELTTWIRSGLEGHTAWH